MKNKFLAHPLPLFFLTSILTAIFYSATASTRLSSHLFASDSGDFLAALLTAGIPHPTGYPTYMLLGILLQKLPFFSPFARAVLLSLIPAALSSGLLALLIRKFIYANYSVISFLFSLFAALFWGLSPLVWVHSVIVEVHGLQSLFIVLALWWLFALIKSPNNSSKSQLFLLALCFGLGLGNHITLVIFLPALILVSVVAVHRDLSQRTAIMQIPFILFGLLVYLYLPVRAAQMPAVNWGNPSSWPGFWWLISGQPYQKLLTEATVASFFTRISALAVFLRQQFGLPGIILGVGGISLFDFKSKLARPVLLYLFFAYAFFAILYGTADSQAYLLASLAVFVIWISLALPILQTWVWKKVPAGWLILAASALLFVINIPHVFRQVDPRTRSQPADFAETLLTRLPHDAILTTSADPDSFPLGYYHLGLAWRPDLTLITLPLTQFRWYQDTLVHNYPQTNFPLPIETFSNNSTSWGYQIPSLNPARPYCASSIQEEEIRVSCTSGESFTFPLVVEGGQ